MWKAGLSLRYFHNDALEAGYLDYESARDAPRSSPDYAQADRSERTTRQAALHLDGRAGAHWTWNAKAYLNDYQNQRWVRFSEASLQQERDTDETHRGLLADATWQPQVAGLAEFTLQTGVDAQWQDNHSGRYRTVLRERTAPLRDWDFDLATRGAYVQLVLRPSERLKLVPGYRVDRIDGDFHDRMGGTSAPAYDYGLIKQPKFSASYALSSQLTAYANWGRTFQIGSGNGAYRTQPDNVRPSINDGWEAGFKFAPAAWIDGRVAYWEQRASDEVATILGVDGTVGTGEVGNVGATLRRGWDAQLNLAVSPHWRGWLSYARQKASIVTPDPSAPDTRGREIENVPRWLANAGVEFKPVESLRLSAWGNAQGDYFVERSNTLGRHGGYVLFNVSAAWDLDARNTMSLQLKNLADRHYVYAWYDSGTSGYSPGDGRALYASWDWRF